MSTQTEATPIRAAIITAAYNFRDTHLAGSKNLKRTAHAELEGAIDAALKLAEQPAQQEPLGCEWTPCMKLPVVVHVRKQYLGEAHVSTREGITPVHPDDLIMRGVSGEEYPIGITIFLQTYTLDTTPQAQPAPKENQS